MKKLVLNNNVMDKILIAFLFIQPIFDIKFFYNSISTLIRVIIIFILFLFYFCYDKNKSKYYLIFYPFFIGVYFIFHHINALHFTSLVPNNFNYSILKEFLYFVKMLSPFLLIYCLYHSSISNKKIINIIQIIVISIGLVIIISNIFQFSYGNYSDTVIKANFFEWFNPNSTYTYQDLASKGLFKFGNQITAILIMYLPFTLLSAIRHHSFINYFSLTINIFSLILLCTRVAILGILIVFTYTCVSLIFIAIINKKHCSIKQFYPVFIVLLFYLILLPFNPIFNRLNELKTISDSENTLPAISLINTNSMVSDTTESVDSTTAKLEYIENTYTDKQVHKEFLFDFYPYKYDTDFWYDFLQNNDISLITNYRFVETSIIKRVVEVNNNPFDRWFGITNTRLQNIFNIEKDFVVQYYALGIIGIQLVFTPYIIFLIMYIIKAIKSHLRILTIENILSCITIIFMFGIAYMSGNLLNSLSFTIYFSLIFIFFKEKT